MSNERVLSEVVSKFFVETCLPRRLPSVHAVHAARHCATLAVAYPEAIPLITGSAAEFYIEPLLPHVGDIDVMFHKGAKLAVPRGLPPPTQLPDEFHNSVQVFEIIDSDFPAYVYLKLRYLLTECGDDDDKYNYFQYDQVAFLPNMSRVHEDDIHGPAVLFGEKENPHRKLMVDAVYCVRCNSWPSQAARWPTRNRNRGWPDSATVDHIVSSGCDVVGVAHRQCRQHEWMSEHQHRLSFSRAEIVLINSWMPQQQIVYHMLRVFTKMERLRDSDNNSEFSTLSNYHIKTIMLWACELKPSSWWTGDFNLMKISVELLHTLSVWLTDARCQHYFINECNLLDNSSSMKVIADRLMSIDEAWLSAWFVNNYIIGLKRSEHIPNMSVDFWLFIDSIKLQAAVSAVAFRKFWRAFLEAEMTIPYTLWRCPLNVRSCICWMSELDKIDTRLAVYFTAIAFLHVAYRISKTGFTEELLDVLVAVTGHSVNTRRHPSDSDSVCCVNKAAKLMKELANKSRSTVQLIEIELCKAYLYRALRCKDSNSDSIYCLANAYLAGLYYTTGQHETAIGHCTLAKRSQNHSQCSKHVVQGELLPKIDESLDSICGLAVLYQYVRKIALNQQETQYVACFTAELFAHCLHITHTGLFSDDEVRVYSDSNKQLFIADVLALKSVTNDLPREARTNYQPATASATEMNTSELVELLQQSAVEHLTTFRQLEVRDTVSQVTIVTTEFEALFAYKHGDYERCLQLSTQNVHTLLYARYTPFVWTYPEFIQLLDDDIVCLTATTLIVNPKCKDITDLHACISQLALSLYLMTQCQLKLHHSLTSLAQTLNYIEVARRRCRSDPTLDQLTLKLIERKVLMHVSTIAHA